MGIIQKTNESHLQRGQESEKPRAPYEEEIPFIPAFDLLKKPGEVPSDHLAAIAVSLWRLLGGPSVGPSRWSSEGAAKRF